jgi:hypothetical protein
MQIIDECARSRVRISPATDGAARQRERARNGRADGVEDEGTDAAQVGPIGVRCRESRISRGEARKTLMPHPVGCLHARHIDDFQLAFSAAS